MEQSPSWEADSHSASQEIPLLLWSLKVLYRVYKSSSPVPILSHENPVHTFPPYFPKISSNILPSASRSPKWSLPLRFSDQNFVLPHSCPTSLILLYLMSLIPFSAAYKLWSSSLCSLFQPPATYFSYVPIFSSAPCSQTPPVCVLPIAELYWNTFRHIMELFPLIRSVAFPATQYDEVLSG
jgi:hypothetical protein